MSASLMYWVHILASKPYGTLYVGVTNNILGRTEHHRDGIGSDFTSRTARKTIKHYIRAWKINFIEKDNPDWIDLRPSLLDRYG